MSVVTPEQIRTRLAFMAESRREYEKSAADGTLRRHEAWRLRYLVDPYLIGAPDERVGKRFRNVFINQTELGPDAKIGMLPPDVDDSFMQSFTHLQEEYAVRGGVPDTVVADARSPVLNYFANGDPIALSIFAGYAPPPGDILVKYGQRQFLEPMLREGLIRICPASHYNNDGFLDAVRDDEVTRNFFIPTYRERLEGRHHIDFQGHRIEFGNDDILLPVVIPDYYLLSLCNHIYYRMPTDFGADAALIIHNPVLFTQRVISAFLARMDGWSPHVGPVTYYDPYRDYTKFRIPEMAKHFGYSYQREYRVAFRSTKRIHGQLEPVHLDIGGMEDYAELLWA